MNIKRQKCTKCHYPIVTCVCCAVEKIPCTSRITVLQHPSETKVAKNTLRLLQLMIPTVEVCIGETLQDFRNIQQRIQDSPYSKVLVYPGEKSQTISDFINKNNITGRLSLFSPLEILFIDGTWRKAFKIYQLNSWLQTLPSVRLELPNSSHYTIRKSNKNNSLSTLEAVAFSLQMLEGISPAPFLKLLKYFIQQQSQFSS